jgi:hypothetical protein
VLETDERAAELLAPLRALEPDLDTFARIPAAGMLEVHMDPPGPVPAVSDHCTLGELTDDAIDALLGEMGPGTRPVLLFAELRHLGGAFGRPVPGGGAVSHVPGDYSLFCAATAPNPEAATVGRAAGQALVRALAPWKESGRVPTLTEARVEASSLYDDEALARITELRATLDPDQLFVASHQI